MASPRMMKNLVYLMIVLVINTRSYGLHDAGT